MKKQFMEVGHKTRAAARQDALRQNVNKVREKAGLCPLEVPLMKNVLIQGFGAGKARLKAGLFDEPGFDLGGVLFDNHRRFGNACKIGTRKKYGENYHHHIAKPWQRPFTTAQEYLERLRKRGFKRLGSGHYSTVMAKPGCSQVVKVSHNSEDDPYPLFAAWAHKNPSPFLPVVHSFKRHKDFYVVVLDRLEKTANDVEPEAGIKHATDHFYSYARDRVGGNPISDAMTDAAFSFFPGLRPVIDALKAEFKRKCEFDMHAANWMLSGTGQLVLTDPLSHAGTSKEEVRAVTRIKASTRRIAA